LCYSFETGIFIRQDILWQTLTGSLMPQDDWRKARDRSVARKASREFALEGRSSFPYVWGDDPLRPLDVKSSEQVGDCCTATTKVVWCVCDNKGGEIAHFDQRDRTPADVLAARLQRQTGMEHFVVLRKVPFIPHTPTIKATTPPPSHGNPALGTATGTEPAVVGEAPHATVPSVENQSANGPWYRRLWQFLSRVRRWF